MKEVNMPGVERNNVTLSAQKRDTSNLSLQK
jgi:hypothetical protein